MVFKVNMSFKVSFWVLAKYFEHPASRGSSVIEDDVCCVKIKRVFSEERCCLNIKFKVECCKYMILEVKGSE